MAERPILFSAPMVRAILAGEKTQTRRVVKPQPYETPVSLRWCWDVPPAKVKPGNTLVVCDASRRWWEYLLPEQLPYQPGDTLRVKEAWAVAKKWDSLPPSKIPKDLIASGIVSVHYMADGPKPDWCGRTRSLRFMPRWASRLNLKVVSVQGEQVQDISDVAVWDEGLRDCFTFDIDGQPWIGVGKAEPPRLRAFRQLWDSINAKKHPWESNPWVWVVEFRRLP